jgi:uridylate kinase
MSLSFDRILIKISGEYLSGDADFGIDLACIKRVTSEIKALIDANIQVSVVVGGGNVYRGVNGSGSYLAETTSHHMGMVATAINALALRDGLRAQGIASNVLSSVAIGGFVEQFSVDKAMRAFDEGSVSVFACGTGNPFFTTDTVAVLRALETKSKVVLKATNVNGVYDKDPAKHDDAVRYETVTFDQVIEKRLQVMDATAFTLARDNHLPIVVFNLDEKDVFSRIVQGEQVGTIVSDSISE